MTTGDQRSPHWCFEVIDSFRSRYATSAEHIAELTWRLADSGERLDLDPNAADVASTGGPASLTTFIPPLVLAASGTHVPKIGVPGRPAGVIDTLGVLPGYRTSLTRTEFTEAILKSGFGSTLSAGVFAPDDGVLFRARQQQDAQALPALVIASLLSKKLAAGLTRVAFDVRMMDGGNFGATPFETAANIQLMRETAALLDIQVSCVVSDGRVPSQPMLGRAEALRGLFALLDRRASAWLEQHFESCLALATQVNVQPVAGRPDRGRMREVLDQHLRAQGASGIAAAEEYLEETERTHLTSLVEAPADGRLGWDMVGLRTVVLAGQRVAEHKPSGDFPDSCGVELLRNTGELVKLGEPIARVRGQSPGVLRRAFDGVERCMTVEVQEREDDHGGLV